MTFALSKSEEEEKDHEAETEDVLYASLVTVFHRGVCSRIVLAFVKNMQK